MPFIQLIISLIIVGVLLWAINTFIPMSRAIRKLINVIVVIAAVLYALRYFGVFTLGPRIWVIG